MNEPYDILIIDDEPIVGERLMPFLVKDGYRVETFSDPREALTRLDQKEFDIVVTDIRMGDIDGIQIMERVLEKSKAIKVIMITGYATMELARESLNKGAFDFIAKPFKLKEIRQTIKRAVDASAADKHHVARKAV